MAQNRHGYVENVTWNQPTALQPSSWPWPPRSARLQLLSLFDTEPLHSTHSLAFQLVGSANRRDRVVTSNRQLWAGGESWAGQAWAARSAVGAGPPTMIKNSPDGLPDTRARNSSGQVALSRRVVPAMAMHAMLLLLGGAAAALVRETPVIVPQQGRVNHTRTKSNTHSQKLTPTST